MSDPVLEIERLVFRYPGAEEATVRVGSLVVGEGESVVLTGSSGAGKSTLLHLILGVMDPTSGVVRVMGRDVHGLRGAARDRFRGRSMGMVFQTHHLLVGFTALENVMAALKFSSVPRGVHADRARGLLARLGIERAGARVEELSIGQQQRVAIARAVACGPGLVLADEPTAALDEESARESVDLLDEARRSVGAALVAVTHDRSLVGRFDRHVELGDLVPVSGGV